MQSIIEVYERMFSTFPPSPPHNLPHPPTPKKGDKKHKVMSQKFMNEKYRHFNVKLKNLKKNLSLQNLSIWFSQKNKY